MAATGTHVSSCFLIANPPPVAVFSSDTGPSQEMEVLLAVDLEAQGPKRLTTSPPSPNRR